jgi:thiol-disulfide isomerase/thioredoxin
MKRILWAIGVVALGFGLGVRADDPKTKNEKASDEKKDRAAEWRDIRAEFQKLLPEVIREWRSAGSEAERNKALARLDPITEKAYEFINKAPKDDIVLEAAIFLLGTRPQPPEAVVKILAEHHLDNEKFASVLPRLLVHDTPAVQNLLRRAMEESKNKNVRGIATFSYARSRHEASEVERNSKRAADLVAEAEKMLQKVVKEFGDVPMGRRTLKEEAEKLLFVINHLSIGKKAPEVVSRDLDDKEVRLSSLQGKVVVLDIWATWCGPCRAMIPHEREMVEKLKDRPFVLVSISADEKKETLKDFLEKESMPWVHWWEGRREGGILNDWNVQFFPTIYILDHKGVIRYKNIRGKEMEEAVVKLLDEMEKGQGSR